MADVIVRRNPKPESWVDGKKQAWVFTNEVDAEELVLNQSTITDLVPTTVCRGAQDINGGGYTWKYSSEGRLELFHIDAEELEAEAIISIDLITKNVVFLNPLFVKDPTQPEHAINKGYFDSLQNYTWG